MKILNWHQFSRFSELVLEDREQAEYDDAVNYAKGTVNHSDPVVIKVKKLVAYSAHDIIGQSPFFGRLLTKLSIVYTTLIPTAAVDGISLFINPDFFKDMTREQCRFVIYHEIMHCALLHFTRLGGRDPERFNVAGDYEINLLLANAGFGSEKIVNELNGLFDRKYEKMNTEQIYTDPNLKVPPPDDNGKDKKPGNDKGGHGTEGPLPDDSLSVGDVIYDVPSGSYGKVTAIDSTVSPSTVQFDPISREEAESLTK